MMYKNYYGDHNDVSHVRYFFSPYRIVDDCGGAFAMGATMGSLFHFWKGYRNSPAVS